MKNSLLITVAVCAITCFVSLAAIKPTRSFMDSLNRTELHVYCKNAVHRSMTRNASTALIAGGATCYLAKKHAEHKPEDACKLGESEGSSNSSGAWRVGWVGGATLLTACITARSALNCHRLWKIIKTSNMPTVRSEQFQASLALGMQPNRYYWVSKPLKNLFWS